MNIGNHDHLEPTKIDWKSKIQRCPECPFMRTSDDLLAGTAEYVCSYYGKELHAMATIVDKPEWCRVIEIVVKESSE